MIMAWTLITLTSQLSPCFVVHIIMRSIKTVKNQPIIPRYVPLNCWIIFSFLNPRPSKKTFMPSTIHKKYNSCHLPFSSEMSCFLGKNHTCFGGEINELICKHVFKPITKRQIIGFGLTFPSTSCY